MEDKDQIISEQNSTEPKVETAAIIEIKNTSVYQGETLVLTNIDVRIDQGEFVYLIGKTGSGKSTFLKMLYGDLPIDKGTGSIAETDLSSLKKSEVPFLRRKLGIVFQDFQLLTDRTVHDNLSFVLKATGWKDQKAIKKRIETVLGEVGLSTKGFKMPHELSGGEQQRVVIARALLNNPKVILADEPTGNLDPDTSDDIMRLLKSINQEMNTAVLMATHNYSILEKFPARILECVQGQITDRVTTSD